MNSSFLLCVCCFFTAYFFVLALMHGLKERQKNVQLRLERIKHQVQEERKKSEEPKKIFLGLQKFISFVGKILERRGIIQPLTEKMIKAGIPLRGEEYLVLWLLSTFIPGLLFFMISGRFLPSLLFCLLGYAFPPLLVKRAEQQKLKKFNQQLVDALSIIANSLRAGHSLMQAIELVGKELPDPIGKEFRRTFREISLGATVEGALRKLGQRVASDDLGLMITAVLIQRQIGGNLAEIMDNISETIRDRIRIQGEIRTLTAQGRLSGLVIGLIPLFLIGIMFILNPDYLMPLFTSSLGLIMLGVGIIGEIIGVLFIRKIISIDI